MGKLPTNVEVSLSEFDLENTLPEEFVSSKFDPKEIDFDEQIGDYLADTYGFCVFSFTYRIEGQVVVVSDINWDTTE